MAKRTSLAKQLGLSDDPVQPQSFSREAFKLSPVPVRGGGWSTAVAATPTPSQTNLGRLSGALSQVSGLLAQAKAFEDKKLEMEHKGLQIDHQTALSQIQGQAMDARIGELATKMDMAEQMTAEAAEANYWASLSFDERERAEREQAEFVDEIGKIRTDAQNEMFKQEAQTPEAKKDPVVKNERRELYRGAQVARDFPAALTEALQEWAEGSGEEGVQFRPSEEDYNAFVIQFTERYKGEHNIEIGSTADRAFNVGTRRVFETVVPTEKVKLFAALEGEVLIDDIKQAEQTLGDIISAGGGSLQATEKTLLDDSALEAPWWNTLKGRSLKQKDAFFKLYVDNLLAQSEANPAALETAKLLLRLPDKDPEFKYRSDAPFSESSLYLTQLNRILLAEEQQEERAIAKVGKQAESLASRIKGPLAFSLHDFSADELTTIALDFATNADSTPTFLPRIFGDEPTETQKAILREIEEAPLSVRHELFSVLSNQITALANNKDELYNNLRERLIDKNGVRIGQQEHEGGLNPWQLHAEMRANNVEISNGAAAALGYVMKDGKPSEAVPIYKPGMPPEEVTQSKLSLTQLANEVYGPANDIARNKMRNEIQKYISDYKDANNGKMPNVEQMTIDLRERVNAINGVELLEDIALFAERAHAERMPESAPTFEGPLSRLRDEPRMGVGEKTGMFTSESTEQRAFDVPGPEGPIATGLFHTYEQAFKKGGGLMGDKPLPPGEREEQARALMSDLKKQRGNFERQEETARQEIIEMFKMQSQRTGTRQLNLSDRWPGFDEATTGYIKYQKAWEQKAAYGLEMDEVKRLMTTTINNNKDTGFIVLGTGEEYWNEAVDEIMATGYSVKGFRLGGAPPETAEEFAKMYSSGRGRPGQTGWMYQDNAIPVDTLKVIRPPIANLPQGIVSRNEKGEITKVNEKQFAERLNLNNKGLIRLSVLYGFSNTKDFIKYQYDHPVAVGQRLSGEYLQFK